MARRKCKNFKSETGIYKTGRPMCRSGARYGKGCRSKGKQGKRPCAPRLKELRKQGFTPMY